MRSPEEVDRLTTLGLNLTRSCKYLHDNQGVNKEDLIWVLHGIIGQVLSWDRHTDSSGDEFPKDGRGFDPEDL